MRVHESCQWAQRNHVMELGRPWQLEDGQSRGEALANSPHRSKRVKMWCDTDRDGACRCALRHGRSMSQRSEFAVMRSDRSSGEHDDDRDRVPARASFFMTSHGSRPYAWHGKVRVRVPGARAIWLTDHRTARQ